MPTDVALSLKYLRRSAGYTQGQVAEILRVDRITVTRWETGRTRPSEAHQHALAGLFSVPTWIIRDALGMAA